MTFTPTLPLPPGSRITLPMTRSINRFLLENNLRIRTNPCISPDFCLDWPSLAKQLERRGCTTWAKSGFDVAAGKLSIAEDPSTGDCAWILSPADRASAPAFLRDGVALADGTFAFPATWDNLITVKNRLLEHDPESTVFPSAGGSLARGTIGVGARFTTLHWPAVEWAMSALGVGLTANQNSIPRELVYDVDAMLEGRLDTVPFPFIGADVPEGHQGQSVEGMSHGCVLSKLRTGFHNRGIPWSFNADHQPVGGKFDIREDALVRGCLLATYITFDISPQLALNAPADASAIPAAALAFVRKRVAAVGLTVAETELVKLLCTVWPSMLKMKARDEKYRAARAAAFTTEAGRRYMRELSIDELPGLTTPETTAVMLALCEHLEMPVDFVAPAFGFQKNAPYADNARLRGMIEAQWRVVKAFGTGIGFHSGSGKSAENYRVMGEVTGCRLEIKTSGRYTYEMGRALFASTESADQTLWQDWYRFTVDMAVGGAFSADPTERKMARSFIETALGAVSEKVFAGPAECRSALEALPPSPEHMFFFEYNFLYVLAAGGKADKRALGDHTRAGYTQRARFYGISPKARLEYARRVADYLIFLSEEIGLVPARVCAQARQRLYALKSLDALVEDIAPLP
jgi:tagaturonate epimerase